jgi:hypothetical protein
MSEHPTGDWPTGGMTIEDRAEMDRLTAAILAILHKHGMVKTDWNQVKGTMRDGREVTQQVIVKGYVRDTKATRAAYERMLAAAEAQEAIEAAEDEARRQARDHDGMGGEL